MIKLEKVKFSYDNTCFIDVENLIFCDGSFTALIGENGSAKTTALKLMTGEKKAEKGDIFIDGKSVSKTKRSEISKMLSYFPQDRPIADMSVFEAVLMGRYPYNRDSFTAPQRDRDMARKAMEKVGISHFSERSLKTLSFGERQKVYLAMQMAQDTKNCIFDEPTNFMDVSARFSLLSSLAEMKNEGKCIVCVLHDIGAAMQYADRIVIMNRGKIFADGTPKELYEKGSIDEAFGIKLVKNELGGEDIYTVLPKKSCDKNFFGASNMKL